MESLVLLLAHNICRTFITFVYWDNVKPLEPMQRRNIFNVTVGKLLSRNSNLDIRLVRNTFLCTRSFNEKKMTDREI